jgi:hypothetical protein
MYNETLMDYILTGSLDIIRLRACVCANIYTRA